MDQPSTDQDFIKHLHDEKVAAQDTRSRLVIQKLTFATVVLGLGTLNFQTGQMNTSYAILLAPLVAIVFDFYIMGEDFGIKRIGFYLRMQGTSKLEQEWETFVSQNRDPFAFWAIPILSWCLIVASGVIAWLLITSIDHYFLTTWIGFCFLVSVISFICYWDFRNKIQIGGVVTASGDRKLDKLLKNVREVAADEGNMLTEKSYRELLKLYLYVTNHVPYLDRKELLSREYQKDEFLAVVDIMGNVIEAPSTILHDFRHSSSQHPELKEWFHEHALEGEKNTLLVARWLCHAVGIRHGTSHLILTMEDDEDQIVVQLRSMKKAEAPGCFDLPVAGHVDGLQSYDETIRKEAEEELGLNFKKLSHIEYLRGYEQTSQSKDGRIWNAEYHRVYRAQLSRGQLAEIKPDPEEVAGIMVLSQIELKGMMKTNPERFASGIMGTLMAFP